MRQEGLVLHLIAMTLSFVPTTLLALILGSNCAVAQENTERNYYCRELAGAGISLSGMLGSETRDVRGNLTLQTIRLCPREFISAASIFPSSDSPLPGIREMTQAADPSLIAPARKAIASVRPRDDPGSAAVTKQLLSLLGQPQTKGARNLVEVERRDSLTLANLAAAQKARTGERQSILIEGVFVMWVINRVAINAAFESVPSAQEWLRPFPPGIVMVGEGEIGEEVREFERSVIRRAQAHDGPVDKWYRGFKVEQ
ncbi:MAG: hypothetical protein QM757_24915 [Paludibaculum sp.]